MKRVEDIVILFKEDDGKVTGMMVQNGHTEFYKCSKASNEYVRELLEINQVEK